MKRINLEGYIHDIIQRKITTYHVEVRQHGEVVGKFDWRDNRRDNIHSVSKSFVSMAVGIAVHEGVLRLDEKPAEIWPEKLPRNPAPNLLKMTVRDAIMMA